MTSSTDRFAFLDHLAFGDRAFRHRIDDRVGLAGTRVDHLRAGNANRHVVESLAWPARAPPGWRWPWRSRSGRWPWRSRRPHRPSGTRSRNLPAPAACWPLSCPGPAGGSGCAAPSPCHAHLDHGRHSLDGLFGLLAANQLLGDAVTARRTPRPVLRVRPSLTSSPRYLDWAWS